MSLAPSLAEAVDRHVERESPTVLALARKLHESPELRFEEVKAAAWIRELLEERGFAVEQGLGGMATSLRAISKGKAPGPRVAILAEYDALPEIGHACGHNLIAAGGVGAFLAAAAVLSEAAETAGEVVLFGTPAEEGGGGKIRLLQAGAFEGVAAAIMFHPFDRDLLMHVTLASAWFTFDFHGKPSHAAIAPHDGTSALTACLDTLRLIDGQRVHFRDGVRVHGFVTNGGQAVNIIPERASCEVSVRARDAAELQRVRQIVERCARAAAMASDVEITLSSRQGYLDMVNNAALATVFGSHMRALGRAPRNQDESVGAGSTDMGDISHAVPAIHPWVAIVDQGAANCHEQAFARAACSERGMASAIVAAKAMARTTLEFLTDAALRAAVTREYSEGGRFSPIPAR